MRQSNQIPVLGIRNRSSTTKKFLSIGIASVYRQENYLEKALNSFLNESFPEERENVVVVVYLADTEPDNKYANQRENN
jgi:hypothetical protein